MYHQHALPISNSITYLINNKQLPITQVYLRLQSFEGEPAMWQECIPGMPEAAEIVQDTCRLYCFVWGQSGFEVWVP